MHGSPLKNCGDKFHAFAVSPLGHEYYHNVNGKSIPRKGRLPLFEECFHAFFLIIRAEALGAALHLQPDGVIEGEIIPKIHGMFDHF
jgi:hypothetical protein